MFSTWVVLTLSFARPGRCAFDLGFNDDSDLTNFVTRPEIKAPLYDVQIYNPQSVTEGYWFVAPYVELHQKSYPLNQYQACQIGPHIYDQFGNLVWSGACAVENQNTFDFRAWPTDDGFVMTAILAAWSAHGDPIGHGIVMNDTYDVIGALGVPDASQPFNMHEMQLMDNGTSVVQILARTIEMDASLWQLPGVEVLEIRDMGFREVDMYTGETLFEWWALDEGRIQIGESRVKVNVPTDKKNHPWDWFHANAIDKNTDGDYLLSSRYTDTIYKISGKDGSILWRLGGRDSSFFLENFNFSRQHDARWLSIDHEAGKEIITFLDNAADDYDQTSETSSALTVVLDVSQMTARVVKRIERPDGELTRLRGNFQTLSSGNDFVCWAGNSYMTEHDTSGNIVMEARFRSDRFVTYRAFKKDFKGYPREAPAIKAMSVGTSEQTCTTVMYVSWNGATEAAIWRFFDGRNGQMIGEKNKTGFETVLQEHGCFDAVFAQAIALDGEVLGQSPTEGVGTLAESGFNPETDSTRAIGSSRSKPPIEPPNGDTTEGLSVWMMGEKSMPLLIPGLILIVTAYSISRTLWGRRMWIEQAQKLHHAIGHHVD